MSDQVEEVKQKTDIVALIAERVKLSRAGSNFKALCPFHSERTPSFMVSAELGIYKCFGCGKGGDVYSFLKEFEGMDFPEALSYLADRAGVKLTSYKKDKNFQRKERLRSINHLAGEYYHYLLTKHEVGKQALRYLLRRGVRRRSIDTFQLGYAPFSWDGLIRYLVKRKKCRMEDLESVGLVIRSSKFKVKSAQFNYYDRFRDRVIFPLRDVAGHVVGFAGRVLPNSSERRLTGKYINSPETELYNKSEHVYGLFENKQYIKKADQVVAVEGELDMISSWQAAVRHVVAVKGTAATSGQFKLLSRYTNNLVLALDADVAGEKATKRSVGLADEVGLNAKVAILSGGKDPDEIAQSDPKKWRKMVEKACSVYDFYLSRVRKRFDLNTGLGKKQASGEVIPILSQITNTIEQAHYIKKFARLLDTSEEVVGDEIARYLQMQAVGQLSQPALKDKGEPQERTRSEVLGDYFLALLLQGGKVVVGKFGESDLEFISNPGLRRTLTALFKEDLENFQVGEFVKSIPMELRAKAQEAYLKDLGADFDKGRIADESLEVAKELRTIFLKDKMKEVFEKIKELEEGEVPSDNLEKKLVRLRKEFGKLSKQLSELTAA